MSRFIWGWIATSVVVLSATAVQAQIYYPDGPVIIRRGPYAAVPSGPVGGGYDDESPYDESIPPREVMRMLRSTGFHPLGPPVLRRFAYTVSAVNAQGENGRVVVDARSGRILRFMPDAAGREEAATAPGAPATAAVPNQKTNAAQGAPKPPPPRVASRTPQAQTPSQGSVQGTAPGAFQGSVTVPASAAKPAASTVGTAPPADPAAAAPTKSAEIKPADAKPATAKPTVQLLPTQPMPPVQGLD